MHLIDRMVILDPDGCYFLDALRTAVSLTLGILVCLFMPSSALVGYRILMGLFAVQIITGDTAIKRILSGSITTCAIAIIVLF